MTRIISLILAVIIAVQPTLIALGQPDTPEPIVLTEDEPIITQYLLDAIRGGYPADAEVILNHYTTDMETWTFSLRIIEGETTTDETLSGTIHYDIETTGTENYGVQLQGTLSGDASRLTIDLTVEGTFADETFQQLDTYTLVLERGGNTLNSTVQQSILYNNPTFDTSVIESSYALTQGAIVLSSSSRIATRQIDRDNSEVWIETLTDGGLQLEAHLWERFTGETYTQFFDTFNGELNGVAVRLAEPGNIRITPDGVDYNITLIDSDGVVVPLTDDFTAKMDGLARQSPYTVPKFSLLLSPCSRGAAGAGGAASGVLGAAASEFADGAGDIAGFLDDAAAAGLTPGEAGAGAAAGNVAGQRLGNIFSRANLVGFLSSFLIGIIAERAKENIRNDPTLTPAERAEAESRVDWAAWGANVAIGLALALATGGLGAGFLLGAVLSMPGGPIDALGNALANLLNDALCNADPYFSQPDIRRLDTGINGAVQVEFINNGNYDAPPTPQPRSTDAGATYEYRDNPQNLLAGAIPEGATAIGTWTWDETRTFNGIPSHTGTGVHYYIEAEPFIMQADDNLVQYLYIDPENPPQQIYLQVYIGDGDGEHRVYWGENIAQTGGIPGTASLYPAGDIPLEGWVRLTIPAETIGIADQPITGVLYGSIGGEAWWGTTTTAEQSTDNAPDRVYIDAETIMFPTVPGAQVGFSVGETGNLSVTLHTQDGEPIRVLVDNQPVETGFRAVTWDGRNETGEAMPEGRYLMRFTLNNTLAAEVEIRTTPLNARLLTPNAYSVIRGNGMPIVGLAYGPGFESYVVEYGEGLNPTEWTPIYHSDVPAPLPIDTDIIGRLHSNLVVWDVGIDEFGSYNDAGLNGVYTLQLRVTAEDGGEIVDRVPVMVGRLAHFATGNTIISPDDNAKIIIPPLAIRDSYVLLGIVPAELAEPDGDITDRLPDGFTPAGQLYEILPPNDTFMQPITLEIPFNADAQNPGVLIGDGEHWQYIPGEVDGYHIRVNVLNFGSGERALVGAFTGDFNTVGTLTLPTTSSAGSLIQNDSLAFYDDFNADMGEWQPLDLSGTQLTLNNNALSIARGDGVRLTQINSTPFNAAQFPIVTFDYRLPPGEAFNLLAELNNGEWVQLDLGGGRASSVYVETVNAIRLIDDGEWQHIQLDLYRLIQTAYPRLDDYTVNRLVLGRFSEVAYEQIIPIDDGTFAYEIDNFAVLRPVNNRDEADSLVYITEDEITYPVLVDRTAPIFNTPSPASAGSPFYIEVPITETNGIDPSSVTFTLNNQPYSHDRRGSRLTGESLEILPQLLDADAISNGSNVDVAINTLTDYAGNSVESPLVWSFIADIPTVSEDNLRQITSGGGSDPALSPIGDRLAYVSNGEINVISVDDPAAPEIFIGLGSDPAWSPDGEQIAFVSPERALQIISADGTGTPETLAQGVASPSWSPDGKEIAFVTDGNIAKIDLQTAVIAPVTDDPEHPYRSVDWQPNGDLLALGFDLYEKRVEVFDLKTGEITPLTQGTDPVWLNDKTVLFTSGADLWQMDLDADEAKPFEQSEGTFNAEAAVARSGGAVAFVSTRGGERDVWVKRTLQLSNVSVSPSPAEPNTPVTISYSLPMDADVTIEIANKDGNIISALTATQSAGMQAQTWDTTGIDEGIYRVRIMANNLERITEAQIQASSTSTEQPIDQPTPIPPTETPEAIEESSLTVTAFVDEASSVRASDLIVEVSQDGAAIQRTEGDNPAVLTLLTGRYDISLSYTDSAGNAVNHTFEAVAIPDVTSLFYPAETGRLIASYYSADAVTDFLNTRLYVYAPGDRETLLADTAYGNPLRMELQEGIYDVVLGNVDEISETQQVFENVSIQPGQEITLEHTFSVGQVEAQYYSADGVTDFTSTRLYVYTPGDRETVLADTAFGNPLRLTLPAGTYDIIMGNVNDLAETQQVFENAVINAGSSLHLEHVFNTGQLEAQYYSADGVTDFLSTRLYVYAPGDRETILADTAFGNPLRLNLPAGSYDVIMQNVDEIGNIDQVFEAITINPGESTALEHVFNIGQLEAQYYSADGVTGFLSTRLYVYAPGDRETVLASTAFGNPLQLNLPAGNYDVVLGSTHELGETQELMAGVTITSGETTHLEHIFNVGQVRVSVPDRTIRLSAYVPSDLTTPIASMSFVNPAVMTLPTGTYTFIVIDANTEAELTRFEGITIPAGEVLELAY